LQRETYKDHPNTKLCNRIDGKRSEIKKEELRTERRYMLQGGSKSSSLKALAPAYVHSLASSWILARVSLSGVKFPLNILSFRSRQIAEQVRMKRDWIPLR
jgi:hypothetical protein